MTNCAAWAAFSLCKRPDHTLRATALVHEAYMRMLGANVEWNDRTHFYAVAARMLRRILVEYARKSKREKTGGAIRKIELEDLSSVPRPPTS